MESPRCGIVCPTRSRLVTSMHSPFGRSRAPAEVSALGVVRAAGFPGMGADQLAICRASRQPALLGGQLERLFAIELGLLHQLLDPRRQSLRRVAMRLRFCGNRRAKN